MNKEDIKKHCSKCCHYRRRCNELPGCKKTVGVQDIVKVNLADDLKAMLSNIVKAMVEAGIKRIIAISSVGIYETPLRPVLIPYRKLAEIIERADGIVLFYGPIGLPGQMKLIMQSHIKNNRKPVQLIPEKLLQRLSLPLLMTRACIKRKPGHQ